MAVDFFPWKEQYSVKSETIDEQHKKLFSIANELYQAFTVGEHKEIIDKIIEELYQYTIYHFKEEERLIKLSGAKLTPEHVLQHEEFVKKVAEVKDRHASGRTTVTYGLMSFLRNWLTDHIMDTDQQSAKEMAEYEKRQARL